MGEEKGCRTMAMKRGKKCKEGREEKRVALERMDGARRD